MPSDLNFYIKNRSFLKDNRKNSQRHKKAQESGNEGYEYFLSVKNPETLLLIDRWKDRKALDSHHASPMMEKILALREKYDLHMRVERFISEETEISNEDEAFIRK